MNPTTTLAVVGPATDDGKKSVLTISKARIKKGLLYCEFTEQHDPQAPARALALTCAEQAHPDLPHVLSRLVPHLCLLAEQLPETPDFWPDEAEELPPVFAPFAVTGFSVGKQQGGVTLIGQRTLNGGKVLNLNSPYVSFEDETEAAYPYAPLLQAELAAALAEVELALRGKCSDAGKQLALFETEQVEELNDIK